MTDLTMASHITMPSLFRYQWLPSRSSPRQNARREKRSFSSLVDHVVLTQAPKKQKTSYRGDFTFSPKNQLFVENTTKRLTQTDETTVGIKRTADKLSRELFIAYTPADVPEYELRNFLNDAMQRSKLCFVDHEPIISCRIHKRYAFVQCATIEDADKALNLNGVPFYESKLRVSRPSKYLSSSKPADIWQDMMQNPTCTVQRRHSVTLAANEINNICIDDNSPSKFIRLKNMITVHDLEAEDIEELLEETKEECRRFGNLRSMFVSQSGVHTSTIFLEYDSTRDAARAIEALHNKTFDGHSVQAEYIDEYIFHDILSK